MSRFIRTASFAFLVLLPAAAGAQTPGQGPFALTRTDLDGPLVTLPQNQAPGSQRRRDSLRNGVVIGAGLGAIAGAVAGTAIVECSECAGFNVPLTFGVVGAGIGAAIGAGIDALHHDHSIVTGSPTRTRRVNLFPLVGKRAQALAASVRF